MSDRFTESKETSKSWSKVKLVAGGCGLAVALAAYHYSSQHAHTLSNATTENWAYEEDPWDLPSNCTSSDVCSDGQICAIADVTVTDYEHPDFD